MNIQRFFTFLKISYPVDVSSNALLYGDPTPEALDAVLDGVSIFEDANLSTPQCLCGRVLNVVVWEDAHWNFITDGNVVSPGCWVRYAHFVPILDN